MNQRNKITAIFIPADYDQPMRLIELDLKYFSPTEWSALESMYPHIGNGCDTVERVQVGDKRSIPGAVYMFLWIDECGLCKSDPQRNDRASLLGRNSLFGNAILCADNGENSVSVPESMNNPDYVACLDTYLKDQLGGIYVFNSATDRIID